RIAYDASNGTVQQVDYDKGTSFYAFDFPNRKATQIDREGNVHEISHDTALRVNGSTTHSRGMRTFDPDPPSYTTGFTHDGNNEVVEVRLPGHNVVRRICDAIGNLRQLIRLDPSGNALVVDFTYEATLNRMRRMIEERG